MDPIRFEVVRRALDTTADEMCVALARASYSTNIKSRLDLSCALLDRRGRVIGQSAAQPCHIAAMNLIVPAAIAAYGEANLAPGDQLTTNDPYQGGVHLTDSVVLAPIFHEGRIVAYAANLAHHVDVGGAYPGSLAPSREVYQEGLILPVVKIASRGSLDTDVFKLFVANIRAKKETAGDFRAQIAANALGARRVVELVREIGRDGFEAFTAELFAYTDRRLRRALADLPEGVFEAEDALDDDGHTDEPIRLRVRVTIGNGRVHFDFAGSDRQRPSAMNATLTQTFAACAYVMRCLVDRDIPVNDAFFRLIEVSAPPGSVTNARSPAGVAGGWEVSLRLCDLLFQAFARALPDEVPAGCKAMVCHAVFGGTDPRSGEGYVFIETVAGGHGGRTGSDGPDAVQTHHQNTQNTPIEEMEVFYPVRVLRYALARDSEGAGRFRGGLGVERDYAFVGHEAQFTVLADRRRFPPRGLFGGADGEPARYALIRADGPAVGLPSKTTFRVGPGDVVRYRTCGGGGYGDPLDRDPELVARDVRRRMVSPEKAEAAYGVALDPRTLAVDRRATEALRRARGRPA
ncbi:MAG TPA: hydantoinase B/oxoprolinase family protein [Geminicoccaceae bacterium]|nr:hydantoinase B/oxoprolinase family protein [Geminicoccaceae bacterium]